MESNKNFECIEYLKERLSPEELKAHMIKLCISHHCVELIPSHLALLKAQGLINEEEFSIDEFNIENDYCTKFSELNKCVRSCFLCPFSNSYTNQFSNEERMLLSFALKDRSNFERLINIGITSKLFRAYYCINFDNVVVIPLYQLIYKCLESNYEYVEKQLFNILRKEENLENPDIDMSIKILKSIIKEEYSTELIEQSIVTLTEVINSSQSNENTDVVYLTTDIDLNGKKQSTESELPHFTTTGIEFLKRNRKIIENQCTFLETPLDSVEPTAELLSSGQQTAKRNQSENQNKTSKNKFKSIDEKDDKKFLNDDVKTQQMSIPIDLIFQQHELVVEDQLFQAGDVNSINKRVHIENTDELIYENIEVIRNRSDFLRIEPYFLCNREYYLEYFAEDDRLLVFFEKEQILFMIELKDPSIIILIMFHFIEKDFTKVIFSSHELIHRFLKENIRINNVFSIQTAYSTIHRFHNFKTKEEIVKELTGENILNKNRIDFAIQSIKLYPSIYRAFEKILKLNQVDLFKKESQFDYLLGKSLFASVLGYTKKSFHLIGHFKYSFIYDELPEVKLNMEGNGILIKASYTNLPAKEKFQSVTAVGYTYDKLLSDFYDIAKIDLYRAVCIRMINKNIIDKYEIQLLSLTSKGLVFYCGSAASYRALFDILNQSLDIVSKEYIKDYVPSISIKMQEIH